MPANNLDQTESSLTSSASLKTTKSITIPNTSSTTVKTTSNYEELMMNTAAQIRDLKTSQNVTESVPVPSSEHVAEIVGRQGCKIKALRAKTNTYIKTPVRGEAPMFVITGRKEDVHTAKREIQLAADHFSQIRARRVNSTGQQQQQSSSVQQQLSPINSTSDTPTTSIKIDSTALNNNPSNLLLSSSSGSSASSISVSPPILSNMSSYSTHRSSSNSPTNSILIKPSPVDLIDPLSQQLDDLQLTSAPVLTQQLQPGQIVKKVSVPYQVVGLVVGPKGSTIKRIQQNTNTYIVTPSRDSQPVFEIQGLPDNVEAAKLEIENYIMLRTSSTAQTTPTTAGQQIPNQTFDQLFTASTSGYSKQLDFDLYNNVIDILDDLKLMSPNSSSLFKSVAAVVDDDTYGSTTTNQTSNIWSSPPALSSASSSTSQITNDDPILFKTDHRSSISSSSSSSDTSSNDLFGTKQFESNNLPLFMNEQTSFDFSSSIMSAFSTADPFLGSTSSTNTFVANFLPQQTANNNTSLSSSISSSNSTNEHALNSLFQQHENLLLNSNSDSLSYLTTSSQVTVDFLQQQSQFNQQYY